jgi:hypothetical protein
MAVRSGSGAGKPLMRCDHHHFVRWQRATEVSLQSRLGPIAATKRNPEPST